MGDVWLAGRPALAVRGPRRQGRTPPRAASGRPTGSAGGPSRRAGLRSAARSGSRRAVPAPAGPAGVRRWAARLAGGRGAVRLPRGGLRRRLVAARRGCVPGIALSRPRGACRAPAAPVLSGVVPGCVIGRRIQPRRAPRARRAVRARRPGRQPPSSEATGRATPSRWRLPSTTAADRRRSGIDGSSREQRDGPEPGRRGRAFRHRRRSAGPRSWRPGVTSRSRSGATSWTSDGATPNWRAAAGPRRTRTAARVEGDRRGRGLERARPAGSSDAVADPPWPSSRPAPSIEPRTVSAVRREQVDAGQRQRESWAWSAFQSTSDAGDRDPVGLAEQQPRRRVGRRADRRRGRLVATALQRRPDDRRDERPGAEPHGDAGHDRGEQRATNRQPRIGPASAALADVRVAHGARRASGRGSARRRRPVRPGPMIDCSWPLPARRTMSPGPGPLERRGDRRRPVRDEEQVPVALPAGVLGTAGDLVEDRHAGPRRADPRRSRRRAGRAGPRSGPSSGACRRRARRPSRRRRSARRRGPPRAGRAGRGPSRGTPGCGRSR